MRWFRMDAEAVSNPKLKLLAFEDRWHFVAICCLKCSGLLDEDRDPKLRERLICISLGVTEPEGEQIKKRLIEVDLIHENWQPKGWVKYQYKSDRSTERTRKYRERKKEQEQELTKVKRHSDVTVTPPHTHTHTQRRKNIGHSQGRMTCLRFDDFWEAYPKKRKKKESREVWKRKRLDDKADELVADVKNRLAQDERWRRGFAPDPTTYLRGERWLDELADHLDPAQAMAEERPPEQCPPHLSKSAYDSLDADDRRKAWARWAEIYAEKKREAHGAT